jgi:putative transposase
VRVRRLIEERIRRRRVRGWRGWHPQTIDGIHFGGQVLVVALGIAESGEKHVLGVWQGATENTTVVKGLLEDLVDRGLDLQQRYLVVLDGSKALRAGVERVFGEQVEVQRVRSTSDGT